MYSLLQLLIRKNYWRMIFRRATWSEAGMNLGRAHKDRRARKRVWALFASVLAPFLLIAYLATMVANGAVFFLPFVLPILWWRRRRAKQDQEAMPRISPATLPAAAEAEKALSPAERVTLRAYFADLALLHAILVARAGSESFLKQQELPAGVEVVTRGRHIDLLRTRGLWDRMHRADRALVMMPDGHWDRAQISQVTTAMEPLRLLRWILQVDYYLPTVGEQMILHYDLAYELVKHPAKLSCGKQMIALAAMQDGREAARVLFLRCLSEAICKGLYDPGNEQAMRWAKSFSEALSGKQHEDVVLGRTIVGEASDQDLLWALALSERRKDFLTWAMELMEGKEPVPTALLPVVDGDAGEAAFSAESTAAAW